MDSDLNDLVPCDSGVGNCVPERMDRRNMICIEEEVSVTEPKMYQNDTCLNCHSLTTRKRSIFCSVCNTLSPSSCNLVARNLRVKKETDYNILTNNLHHCPPTVLNSGMILKPRTLAKHQKGLVLSTSDIQTRHPIGASSHSDIKYEEIVKDLVTTWYIRPNPLFAQINPIIHQTPPSKSPSKPPSTHPSTHPSTLSSSTEYASAASLQNDVNVTNHKVIPRTTAATQKLAGLESYFESLSCESPPSETEQMSLKWLRVHSFRNYVGEGSAHRLAQNGFYHVTGSNTATRCYCCNTHVKDWKYFDNIETRHRQQMPNCPFLQGGYDVTNVPIYSGTTPETAACSTPLQIVEENVNMSEPTERQRHGEVNSSEGNRSQSEDQSAGIPANVTRQREDVVRKKDTLVGVSAHQISDRIEAHNLVPYQRRTYQPTDDVRNQQTSVLSTSSSSFTPQQESQVSRSDVSPGQQGETETTTLLEMGYTMASVEDALLKLERRTGIRDVTADDVLNLILEEEDQGIAQPPPGQPPNISVVQTRPTITSARTEAAEPDSLRKENKKLKEMQLCKVCLESTVAVTCLPCGHLVCCEKCSKLLKHCPICRKHVKDTIKTYMS